MDSLRESAPKAPISSQNWKVSLGADKERCKKIEGTYINKLAEPESGQIGGNAHKEIDRADFGQNPIFIYDSLL